MLQHLTYPPSENVQATNQPSLQSVRTIIAECSTRQPSSLSGPTTHQPPTQRRLKQLIHLQHRAFKQLIQLQQRVSKQLIDLRRKNSHDSTPIAEG